MFRAKHLNTNLDAIALPEETKIEHMMTLAWIVDNGGISMFFSCLNTLDLVLFGLCKGETDWLILNYRQSLDT